MKKLLNITLASITNLVMREIFLPKYLQIMKSCVDFLRIGIFFHGEQVIAQAVLGIIYFDVLII